MIWIETVCDMCNTRCIGRYYRKGSVSKLKAETKGYGWKFIKGYLYCPECQEMLKERSSK